MPVGIRCNLQCGYCYEDPQRDAGNHGSQYDLSLIKAALEESSTGPFLLFGGEPLLMPKAALEELWSWGYDKYGKNSVQTNGTLIDDDHIALFKRYNVGVGISIDGPGPLNDSRWDRTLERTREATKRTESAIARLCEEGKPPGLIVTLHRLNATGPGLDQLIGWFRRLEDIGVRSVGLHLLEIDNEFALRAYAMSEDENVTALLRLRELQKELDLLKFGLLKDLEALLLGDDTRVKCIWTNCDPYTTKAVQGIGGHGERNGCGRVVKDGIDFLTAAEAGYERYSALYRTPQHAGGCQGCRFFLMCRGQCPGTAVDGDWRNKTAQCGVWMRTFEALEADLVREGRQPLSLSPARRAVESALVRIWDEGRAATVASILRRMQGTAGPAAAPDKANDSSRALAAGRDRARGDAGPASDANGPVRQPNGFLRVAWVSARARDTWASRFATVRESVRRTEWMSVVADARMCALLAVRPEELADLQAAWTAHGLSWHALDPADDGLLRYWTAERAATRMRNIRLIAVARSSHLQEFAAAAARHDHGAVSSMLGVPACCAESWNPPGAGRASLDATWSYAGRLASDEEEGNVRTINGPAVANIMWRWLGIRAVPHLPCSRRCSQSISLAGRLKQISRSGDADAHVWLDAILSWPAEWTALHGIAEVRTPILKFCTASDVTEHKYTVRWTGRSYPSEGGVGLEFPYRTPRTRPRRPPVPPPLEGTVAPEDRRLLPLTVEGQ
jgi:uncharacterized protein